MGVFRVRFLAVVDVNDGADLTTVVTEMDLFNIEPDKALLVRACDSVVHDPKLARHVLAAVERLCAIEAPAIRQDLWRFTDRLVAETQSRISESQATWIPTVGQQAPLPGFYYVEQIARLRDRLGSPVSDCHCSSESPGGFPSSHGHLSCQDDDSPPETRTASAGTRLETRRYVCDFCGQIWRVEHERGYDRDYINWVRERKSP